MNEEMFNCIYCKGKATNEMYLWQCYAPGTYFQHWNMETQIGCVENTNNTSPFGEQYPTTESHKNLNKSK